MRVYEIGFAAPIRVVLQERVVLHEIDQIFFEGCLFLRKDSFPEVNFCFLLNFQGKGAFGATLVLQHLLFPG